MRGVSILITPVTNSIGNSIFTDPASYHPHSEEGPCASTGSGACAVRIIIHSTTISCFKNYGAARIKCILAEDLVQVNFCRTVRRGILGRLRNDHYWPQLGCSTIIINTSVPLGRRAQEMTERIQELSFSFELFHHINTVVLEINFVSHNIIIIINETLLKNLKIEHQKSLNFLESLNFITHARPPAGPPCDANRGINCSCPKVNNS